MVSNYTGMHVQANKAIVGANAFAHEAGIHQDGMLKHSSTFEIMTAESVGWTQSRLVLGKHSGRHALKFGWKNWAINSTAMRSIWYLLASRIWRTPRRTSPTPISKR